VLESISPLRQYFPSLENTLSHDPEEARVQGNGNTNVLYKDGGRHVSTFCSIQVDLQFFVCLSL